MSSQVGAHGNVIARGRCPLHNTLGIHTDAPMLTEPPGKALFPFVARHEPLALSHYRKPTPETYADVLSRDYEAIREGAAMLEGCETLAEYEERLAEAVRGGRPALGLPADEEALLGVGCVAVARGDGVMVIVGAHGRLPAQRGDDLPHLLFARVGVVPVGDEPVRDVPGVAEAGHDMAALGTASRRIYLRAARPTGRQREAAEKCREENREKLEKRLTWRSRA